MVLIAEVGASGKHAVLVVDRAAWHVTEKLLISGNLSILPLPPYSPLSNKSGGNYDNGIVKNYDDISHAHRPVARVGILRLQVLLPDT